MQGGALGPTIYKCLKLGIWLSLDKETVWPNQRILIKNDFSHELKGIYRGYNLEDHYLAILLTIFADDMNLYFDTRDQMQTGAIAFINHLLKWGLKVHVSPTIDGQSKSKAMLCPGKKGKRVELQNDGTIIRRELQDNMEEPLSVPGGYIPFCQSYIFLGSVWTKDMKMKAEIQNRRCRFSRKLYLYSDCLKSKSLSKRFTQ